MEIQDGYLNSAVSPTELGSDARDAGVFLWFFHDVLWSALLHARGYSLKKNNKQVQDVMLDLVNQCTRNTLP